MKSFDTVLPPREVRVTRSEILTAGNRHQLRLSAQIGGLHQNFVILADSILELELRLAAEIGFELCDAHRIVSSAAMLN